MDRGARALFLETLTSIAWFAMDGAWMLGASTTALTLAAPTAALAVATVVVAEPTAPARLGAGGIAAWLGMNICWMAHDLGVLASGIALAKAFLMAGAACIVLAATVTRKAPLAEALARFRRVFFR